MIISTFKNSQPASFVIIPVLLVILWWLSWHGSSENLVQNPMPLYNLVVGTLSGFPLWVMGFLGCLITISQTLHLNYVVGKHEVLYKNSYLPALFFILLLGIIPSFIVFSPVLLVNSIFIFILDKLFKLYKSPSPLPIIFDVSFLTGIATLVYLPSISLMLLIAVAIFILKPFSWRDWLVGLLGVIIPFFFTFVFYFWNDGLDELRQRFFPESIRQLWDSEGLMLQGYRITLVVISVLFVLTMVRIRQNFYKNVTRIRNFQQVVFIFLLVAIASLAFTGSVAVYRFSILAIPLAIMISYYFLSNKKAWWNEVLFWVIVGTLIFNHVSSF